MNKFPADFNSNLTGFGGDASKNRDEHRKDIKKTPIILAHGNGANATSPKWGWQTMVSFLKGIGYKDSELWAMDYLGEENDQGFIQGAHREHIDRFRKFVDSVREYLGVQKLDFIAHSLGCGMVNAYLRGLQSDGTWKNEDNRINLLGTFVTLAGGTYGLGKGSQDEFKTGSNFEIQSHLYNGIVDDTPAGSTNPAEQISPVENWKKMTALDNDESSYVAIIAVNDFVDMQYRDTSRREGADLNARYNLGYGLDGHEKVIKDETVFKDFKGFFNRHPPQPPMKIEVDKVSGTYSSPLSITVKVNPTDQRIDYVARRLRKEFQAGYIVESIDEKLSGALANNQSLTLVNTGAWKVQFSATDADSILVSYGVGVDLPVVTIETDNATLFRGSLDVMASTTRGKLYHSSDGQGWIEGAVFHITRTCTVRFIALDSEGIASVVVERAYRAKPVWDDRVTATLCEHFIAKRLDLPQFLNLGNKLGFAATVTLYRINERWVYNPDLEEETDEPPAVSLSLDGGSYAQPVRIVLSARDKVDPSSKIYYTLDGSRPTENSLSFISSGLIEFNTPGKQTLRIRARNSSGHWSDEVTKTYDMDIKDPQPLIDCDKPSGKYAEAFQATLSVSGDKDVPLTVYYTEDGTDPSDSKNPTRKTFVRSQTFPVSGNGHHAILVYAKDSAGNETRKAFAFSIDDQKYPETSIWPSRGGRYASGVEVKLSTSEPCQWTKMTTDGSEPTEENGIVYTGLISIRKTTRLKFRSKDRNGNLEPVRTAHFTITQPSDDVFESDRHKDGYVKANPDGTGAGVGVFGNLGIGSGWDGKDNRAILHFDTASIPDNADIKCACIEIMRASGSGDPWADGRVIQVDVQTGYFGTSQAIQADDWGAPATAMSVARVDRFTSDSTRSSVFSEAGLKAINKTGVTQIRLRSSSPHGSPNHYLFVQEGAAAKLFVEYEPAATASP